MRRPGEPAPATVEAYLAGVDDVKRAALEKLRATIKATAPAATECIRYRLPGFAIGGRLLLSYGATAKHCAFYPGALPVRTFGKELSAYSTSPGTIRFDPDHPLPAALIRKIVKARIAEHAGKPPVRPRSTRIGPGAG